MAHDRLDNIVPLDQLDDFKVAEGDPDVRGWSVVGSDGRKLGEVDQLLVDTNAMKVRYLDVEVEDELLAGEERHVLIPIGYARLDRDNDNIMVDSISSTEVVGLPAYEHGGVTREMETDIGRRFDQGGTTTAGEPFYGAREQASTPMTEPGRTGETQLGGGTELPPRDTGIDAARGSQSSGEDTGAGPPDVERGQSIVDRDRNR